MVEPPNFNMKENKSVHCAQNMVARETSHAARLDFSLCKLHNTILKTISNARALQIRIIVLLWKGCYRQTSASKVGVIYLFIYSPALMNHIREL